MKVATEPTCSTAMGKRKEIRELTTHSPVSDAPMTNPRIRAGAISARITQLDVPRNVTIAASTARRKMRTR